MYLGTHVCIVMFIVVLIFHLKLITVEIKLLKSKIVLQVLLFFEEQKIKIYPECISDC